MNPHDEQQRIIQILRQIDEIPEPDAAVKQFFADRTVLITGGGGSVGSTLCRQLAYCAPRRLILVDIYENNAYLLLHRLRQQHPQLKLELEIGSVADKERMEEIFERWRPEIVCHAAAHKHVPLMERAPGEAIRNNVIGTWQMLEAASHWGSKHFLLISTDKAVEPSSVMGCTKRLAELLTLSRQAEGLRCSAVRFGNVLNSAGSVIPLFRQQITLGGPVTITGKEMRRYFMTLGQAGSLVLTALALSQGRDIFMLEMGQQLSIDLLARALIEEQGLVPDQDIQILYTDPRPGEKLAEQLAEERENFQPVSAGLRRYGVSVVPDANRILQALTPLFSLPHAEAACRLKEITAEFSEKELKR